MFAGPDTSIPTGWLLCDGRQIPRSSPYDALFTILSSGTIYGAGDGVTTYNLPNLQGRVPVGTTTASIPPGITSKTLGAVAGEETHTLTQDEMPSHTHTSTNGLIYSQYGFGYGGSGNLTAQGNSDVSLTGAGLAHNNMQPYLVLNYIIKY
jgi:microcystin-dependent protein